MSSKVENAKEMPAILISGLTKHYQVYEEPIHRLKQILWGGKKKYFENFTALKNINLELKKGETTGIIGRNGSGKSTLLQTICGTLQPSEGYVKTQGQIAALLELGAGFKPEFSGHENIFLQLTVNGFSKKQIKEKYDAIADFADIGKFIDRPVKTYSSGMYVRLAFACAIHTDPDILIIDEALSVGDEAFRRKCFARIHEIQKKGATILFVSHSAQSIIQLCSRAILIDAGEVIADGEPKYVVNQYQKMMNLSGKKMEKARLEIASINKSKSNIIETLNNKAQSISLEGYDPSFISKSSFVYEQFGATISNVEVLSGSGERVNILQRGKTYHFQYKVDFTKSVKNIGLGVLLKTTNGLEMGGASTQHEKSLILPNSEVGQSLIMQYTFVCRLLQGTYFLNAGVTSLDDGDLKYLHRIVDAYAFRVAPEYLSIKNGKVDFDFEAKILKQ